MTAVLQLLQDIANHLRVETSVTPAQLRDLMKKTDLKRLTNRMEELAEPAGGAGDDDVQCRRGLSTCGGLMTAAVVSAIAIKERLSICTVLDDDVLGLAAELSYYFFLALFPAILFLLALAHVKAILTRRAVETPMKTLAGL
jgi:hypothetical protein